MFRIPPVRWFGLLPLLALGLAAATFPGWGNASQARQDQGGQQAQDPPVPEAQRYALLVGVRQYEHAGLSNLDYTENDVVKLAEVLSGHGYQVTLLCDSAGKKDPGRAPTRANIFTHLDAVLRQGKRRDTVLLGFAGHGLQFKEERASYFCPADAHPTDPKTLVSIGEVYRQLDESGAGVRLVLVDACRTTPKARGRGGLDGENAPRPPRGTAVMYSCSPGQVAYESNELRHGVFFYYVLEGLRGAASDSEGEVTWNSLTGYVQRKVSRDVPRTIGGEQYPNVVADLAGEPPVLVPANKEIENAIGMKLVRIPPGRFLMGSPAGEAQREPFHKGSESQHEVEITRPFFLGTREVTQEEYERVMGTNPSYFSAHGGGKEKVAGLDTRHFPVERVSWEDAVAFCRKLSDMPKERAAGRVYHLPTEAEWEYACRGGDTSYQVFHCGNSLSSHQANFDGNHPFGGTAKAPPLERTTAVGSYRPNRFGLYDLHGNVWEWCADWYDKGYYRTSPSQDPKGPLASPENRRVLRGGAWNNYGQNCRAAFRAGIAPGNRDNDCGFRVVWCPGVRAP